MKKFTSLCRDNITGHRMILSDCSFNEACAYLERENLGKYKGMEACSLHVSKIRFEKATFLYDEERGYLMKIETR